MVSQWLQTALAQTVVTTNGNGGGMFMGVGCIGGLISLAIFVLWIVALIDAIRNPSLNGNARVIWVLVIIFLPVLGSLLYFLIGRK